MGRGESRSEGMPGLAFLDSEKVESHYTSILIPGKSLKSAVEAPMRLHHYEGERDLLKLAARLLWSVTRAHALTDGNKRASAILTDDFLMANGLRFKGSDDDLYDLFYQAAASAIDEEEVCRRLPFLTAFGPSDIPFEERYPDVIYRLAQ
jgi:death-on-curing family protein